MRHLVPPTASQSGDAVSHAIRKKAGKTKRKAPLERSALTLPQVADLVDSLNFQDLFKPKKTEWQRYFQSPVDKTAHSVGKSFNFNELGALAKHSSAENFLLDWLEIDRSNLLGNAIRDWLKNGTILDGEVVDKIAERLKKETLPNQALYNQLICRLVRRDQLRYDPDYQIIYQLTPGQSRLLTKEKGRLLSPAILKQVNQNRRAYWGISEVFQSLIAMFDSELGKISEKESREEAGAAGKACEEEETKEFIRIGIEDGSDGPGEEPLTPNRLNMYSPLRFWAPPPAFARCVFHMIFWRSVITNKDLYGRDVIPEPKGKDTTEPRAEARTVEKSVEEQVAKQVEERVAYYYVIINWFNAAKYKIANYDELFRALMAVAQSLYAACRGDTEKKLCDMDDVHLNSRDIKTWFYPTVFGHTTFDQRPELTLMLPFGSVKALLWELALRYHREDGRAENCTKVSDFMKFLRDRALEVILWSKYQMEVRSVGVIPVQHLYRLELTNPGRKNLIQLAKLYDRVRKSELKEDDPERLKINKEINLRVSAAMSGRIDGWVKLVKVYGGVHREIVEPAAISRENENGIRWLRKSGASASEEMQ